MYSDNFSTVINGCPTISSYVFTYFKWPNLPHTCFDIDYATGMITFLPIDKYKKLISADAGCDLYNNSLRVSVKPGKFITKILNTLGVTFSSYEVHVFSDYIAILCASKKISENTIKICRGEDIRKAYLWKSHAKRASGTLGKSCMRYSKTQDHLSLYVDNDNIIQLVTLVNPNDKVLARCLLWNNLYHDRAYYASDIYRIELHAFLFAKQYKDIYNGNIDLSVQLTKWQYRKYPYMDTMKYLFDGGKLASNPKLVVPGYTHKTWKQLTSVNGAAY